MPAPRPLTHERLTEVLSYDRRTGVFLWKAKTGRKVRVGERAGTRSKAHIYRVIRIDRVNYYESVLAWFYVTGSWPKYQVDHRNRIRDDNRWSNLRLATNKQNHENVGPQKNSTSGVKGVTVCTQTGLWLARITHNGVMKNLGRYKAKTDAVRARKAAERQLFTHA